MMNDYEDTLDAIRVDMYERTKGMKVADIVRDMNERARKLGEQYGFEVVSSPRPRMPRKKMAL
jgi:hypothetical protein